MKSKSSLIVIRGNSGAGKSTIARELRLKLVGQGLKTALIEQDYFRRIILKEKEADGADYLELIEQTVLYALKKGRAVILEGILFYPRHGAIIERLMKVAGQSNIYYMDVPLEETIRRHHTKPNAHEFGEEKLREWWHEKDLSHLPNEKIIGLGSTLEQTVAQILSDLDLK